MIVLFDLALERWQKVLGKVLVDVGISNKKQCCDELHTLLFTLEAYFSMLVLI